MMQNFCKQLPLSENRKTLEDSLRGKGALHKFEKAAEEQGLTDSWFAFRSREYENIAINWCKKHKFSLDPKHNN